ncbi:MAG: glycosyltransferase family 2 protein [Bacteroidaceae bacterium]
MLSILIPTYNYNCTQLVKDLQQQAEALAIVYEIIVVDDASLPAFVGENEKINTWQHCSFSALPQNMGRAKIRNILASRAHYDYLLFMDCDGKVVRRHFLANYLRAAAQADVVVGGLCCLDTLPAPEKSLRYYYEQSVAKKKTVRKRNKKAYAQFTTFCFLIHKTAFEQIKFDESFTQYGHEDTFFGGELERQNMRVLHIDNPLCHLGLEENSVYLQKTETSIKSLLHQQEKLMEISHLLIYYKRLQCWGVLPLLYAIYRLTHTAIRKNLVGRKPSMLLFSFYKLAYLFQMDKERNQQT